MLKFAITFSAVFSNILVNAVEDANETEVEMLRETLMTDLAFKENFDEAPKYIAEGTHSFIQLVQNSSVFVDKTMLLNELLNDTLVERVITLNYPQGWGKSVNLHMLKTFLQIQVDRKGNRILPLNESPNYRLFKHGELVLENGDIQKLEDPLLISNQTHLMEEYQGQRPVIFFNLSAFDPGTSFDDLYAEVVTRISDSFAEHEYMKEVFNDIIDDKNKLDSEVKHAEQNLAIFEKLLWKKADPIDVEQSLNFLSKILAQHFEKKVFILVDGYDDPFNNTLLCGAFPTSHEQNFFDFYRKFTFYTFVTNTNLKKAFLTGVIPLATGNLFRNLNNVREITLLNDTTIHKFYGFNRLDVNELLHLFKISRNITQRTYQYYEAYAVGYPPRCLTLQSLPIVHVLNTRGKLTRTEGAFLQRYFEVDSIRLCFNSLLSGLQFPVDFNNLTFNLEDFKTLRKAWYFNENYYGPMVQSFQRYLFNNGYLSLTKSLIGNTTCVRFPTGEMYASLGEQLVNYYGRKVVLPTTKVIPICNRFRDEFQTFVNTEKQTSPTLTRTLEEFFSHVFRPHGYIVNENEETTRLVLDYLSIFIYSFKRYPSYGTEIMLLGKGLGVIIDSTFNKSLAVEALERAKNSISKFPPLDLPRVKYIGINVKPNSTVNVLATM